MIQIYSDGTRVYMYNTLIKKYSTFSGYGLKPHIERMTAINGMYGWHSQSLNKNYKDVPLIAETESLETFFTDYPEVFL